MTNKVYIAPETVVTWTDTGGDETLDLGGLAADGVQVGDIHDLGAGSRPDKYDWKLIIDGFDTAPVVGEKIDLYLSYSRQATAGGEDGSVGVVNAAGTVESLPNLDFLGTAVVQTTTAADKLIVSGRVTVTERYMIPVVHNRTADALKSTGDSHEFSIEPVPPEIQDSA